MNEPMIDPMIESMTEPVKEPMKEPDSFSPGRPDTRLRVPTREDAARWHRVFDDPEVMEYFGGVSSELSVYEELTARQRRHDAELGFCLYSVVLPAPGPGPGDGDGQSGGAGEVIGFAGAQPWPREWGPVGEIEIGWRLGRAYWGKGYATTAAEMTLERVRAAGVGHVVAMVNVDNKRSIAVMRRLGMRQAETFVSPLSRATALCFRLDL